MFRRILVANRGEIALRIVRACHELGIEAVCVFSTADSESLHLRYADVAVCVGPADARQSYLSIPNIVMAAKNTRCEAVHPGYGFLAENSVFARACADNDLVFIGPVARHDGPAGGQVPGKTDHGGRGTPHHPGKPGNRAIGC